MTRPGRRDAEAARERRGSLGPTGSPRACGSPMRRVGFTDRTRVANRKTTGDRVFSIDESVTGGSVHTRVRWIARHVRDDRTTHPERPPIASDAPHVISPEKRRKPQGRPPPTEVCDQSAGGRRTKMRKRRSGTCPEAGRLRSERATRLTCAEGDVKPQERRPITRKIGDRAGRDGFARSARVGRLLRCGTGRSRARTPRRRRTRDDAAVTTLIRVRRVVRDGKFGNRSRRRPTRRIESPGD
jgi:hypothetical protein